tara:strand:+ start:137 stop:475 length:339 start_codon:yes stop_codon:yes gene_type:complete
MIWPPVKAWTSNFCIEGNIYFVAINYGGKQSERWVVLMSVLDSSVVVKVPWPQLTDQSNWECGWNERNNSDVYKLNNNKSKIRLTKCTHPSVDSGLTIPITKKTIRPWFSNI